MKSADLRRKFLGYFENRGHRVVPGASLVPANDPTLFFTNAGMVQFKDVFTGQERRDYARATTVQPCVRVSGKHNDLENVGHTPRHHTFFEMLGNFSFGDYFKQDAIRFAWELLTGELGIDKDRLWITVYEGDDEAFDLWAAVPGVRRERIQRLGMADNFWAMGETGPCGPCSEIHYDHGARFGGADEGPAGNAPRYVEIWNLVFMQFERAADGTTTPLPRPSIDTGMGLERLAAVLQGVYWNYDTDCFTPIMARAAELAGVRPGAGPDSDVALRVIADHARAVAFLVANDVMPSNLGRGYVLRRIARRAIRYGVKIGMKETFLWKATDAVIDHMGEAYPHLGERRTFIQEVVGGEEERFRETLDKGLRILEGRNTFQFPDGSRHTATDGLVPAEVVFKLHDTYGFPPDLTALIAAEQDLRIDEPGYERLMEEQRERGRKAWRGSGEAAVDDVFRLLAADGFRTEFTGYQQDRDAGEVAALLSGGSRVPELREGEEGLVVLDRTPFYAESGGQVGDTGTIAGRSGRASVLDAQKPVDGLVVHRVRMDEGVLRAGEPADLAVDSDRRDLTRLNHSATHLLHAALRQVLGEHVTQKGSLVTPDRLRFDFSHHKGVSDEELARVEDLVFGTVRRNLDVATDVTSFDEARGLGAMCLFGEKYGDVVRVVKMGDFSIELCGGTHVRRTGDIGMFRVSSEGAIAAGIRRIEAFTGPGALAWVRGREGLAARAAEALKSSPEQMPDAIAKLVADRKRLDKELDDLRRQVARAAAGDLASKARVIGGVKVLAAELDCDAKVMVEEANRLKDSLGSSLVVLGTRDGESVKLVAAVSKDLAGGRFHAGNIVKQVAGIVEGSGGGRPDIAQAGGKRPDKLAEALEAVYRLAGA